MLWTQCPIASEPAPPARTKPLTPALPYLAPFALFIGFLALQKFLPGAIEEIQAVRFSAVLLVLLAFSRKVVDWRPARPLASVLCGVAVFLIWVAPEILDAGYRGHWLFRNLLTGKAESSLPTSLHQDTWFLTLRVATSVLLVPVIEELFWRGWLLRYVVRSDFESVPLGHYTAKSFWIVALLFASEHGSYWDVGLAAGVAYNWWVVRTRSLADCVLAHGMTNACLAAYILLTGRWEYWL